MNVSTGGKIFTSTAETLKWGVLWCLGFIVSGTIAVLWGEHILNPVGSDGPKWETLWDGALSNVVGGCSWNVRFPFLLLVPCTGGDRHGRLRCWAFRYGKWKKLVEFLFIFNSRCPWIPWFPISMGTPLTFNAERDRKPVLLLLYEVN